MDELGLNRYCCRRMMLTHVDLIEKLLRYAMWRFKMGKDLLNNIADTIQRSAISLKSLPPIDEDGTGTAAPL